MSWDRLWKGLCLLTCGGMVLQTTGCEATLGSLAAQLVTSVVTSALLGGLAI